MAKNSLLNLDVYDVCYLAEELSIDFKTLYDAIIRASKREVAK